MFKLPSEAGVLRPSRLVLPAGVLSVPTSGGAPALVERFVEDFAAYTPGVNISTGTAYAISPMAPSEDPTWSFYANSRVVSRAVPETRNFPAATKNVIGAYSTSTSIAGMWSCRASCAALTRTLKGRALIGPRHTTSALARKVRLGVSNGYANYHPFYPQVGQKALYLEVDVGYPTAGRTYLYLWEIDGTSQYLRGSTSYFDAGASSFAVEASFSNGADGLTFSAGADLYNVSTGALLHSFSLDYVSGVSTSAWANHVGAETTGGSVHFANGWASWTDLKGFE